MACQDEAGVMSASGPGLTEAWPATVSMAWMALVRNVLEHFATAGIDVLKQGFRICQPSRHGRWF